MKSPIFNLHKLSQAELGQFSVFLSEIITPNQAARLCLQLPSLSVIARAGHVPAVINVDGRGVAISHHVFQHCKALVESGKVIEAIKELRTHTGGGLKECKEFVELMRAKGIWKRNGDLS